MARLGEGRAGGMGEIDQSMERCKWPDAKGGRHKLVRWRIF